MSTSWGNTLPFLYLWWMRLIFQQKSVISFDLESQEFEKLRFDPLESVMHYMAGCGKASLSLSSLSSSTHIHPLLMYMASNNRRSGLCRSTWLERDKASQNSRSPPDTFLRIAFNSEQKKRSKSNGTSPQMTFFRTKLKKERELLVAGQIKMTESEFEEFTLENLHQDVQTVKRFFI